MQIWCIFNHRLQLTKVAVDDDSDEEDGLQDQPKAGSLATLQSIVGSSIM